MNRRAERRIAATSRELLQKERKISEILRLPVIPRLSLLDEASGTYVSGGDRARLDQEGEQGGPPGRSFGPTDADHRDRSEIAPVTSATPP
jgi:hypothetical protein